MGVSQRLHYYNTNLQPHKDTSLDLLVMLSGTHECVLLCICNRY